MMRAAGKNKTKKTKNNGPSRNGILLPRLDLEKFWRTVMADSPKSASI